MKKIVRLKKNEERRIASGHLWAFSNEVQEVEGEPLAGDVVALETYSGKLLGIGFYNPHSLIAVRLLSREEEEIGPELFRKRMEAALALRRKIYPTSESFRLVHGEGDFLPGLIVDKYNEYCAVQTLSYGMDQRLPMICEVLDSLLHPRGIVERNEAPARVHEGLPQEKGILFGSVAPVTISENNIEYIIDLLDGQKTGFFLDQRENRFALRRYVQGAKVLDCFCNDGGFALNAAAGGASSIIGVDSSESAIQRAQKNAAINHVDHSMQFVVADVFDYLEEALKQQQRFDAIVLDPPSFAKSKKTVRKAKRGYKEIHTDACQLLTPGGILATASCSHHIYADTFLEIVNSCASGAGRNISQLEWHGAAPDHPVLPSMPETRYLKFGIFRVE
ncbi:MAG: class I SAM-dependent rRNA methyltransferase [Bacteroidota bacterium]